MSRYIKLMARSSGIVSRPRVTSLFHASSFALDVGDSPRGGGGRLRGRTRKSAVATRPQQPPPPVSPEDPWVQAKDDASGQFYWWNQQTNETTAVGAPKPGVGTSVEQPPASGGIGSGLGGVMAEGFAFGVGSSIARMAVGSMFSAFGGDSDDVGGGDSGSV